MEVVDRLVIVVGEMEVGDIIVIVFAIDEIVDAFAQVLAEIHQIAQAIRLFTDVVILVFQLLKVLSSKGDGLGAGEGTTAAAKEGCDFILEVVLKICTSPNTSNTGNE